MGVFYPGAPYPAQYPSLVATPPTPALPGALAQTTEGEYLFLTPASMILGH